MQRPPLYLLRHGQTEWNVSGRMQGHNNSSLTEKGRAQALAQNRILRRLLDDVGPLQVFASPQGRVRETAALACAGLMLAPRFDARLMEASAGDWEGLTEAEIEVRHPDLFAAHQTRLSLSFAAPKGETYEDVAARSAAFLDELEGPAVLFTHGATMAVMRGLARGLSYDDVLMLDHRQGVIYRIIEGEEAVLE